MEKRYRLGLDLGTNSIGWAMIALNQENQPHKILDTGVRIFSDGRNPKDGTPLAVARREARGIRRRRDRFLARKSKLMNYLIRFDLMPKDEIERKKLELLDPYELRSRALDEGLSPFKLGRAIFHLNQRRGFKSNRKEQVSEDKKLSETKKNQEDLAKRIVETNSRTLGEFFFKERISKNLTARAKPDESGLYPTRIMYENEFDEIKKVQFKNQKLSEENWQEIREIIFYQRPLAPQEKGVCRFLNIHKLRESKLPQWAIEILKARNEQKFPFGMPRAYLALPSYVQFKILSDANNLRLLNKKTGEAIFLSSEERSKIIKKLNNQKSDPDFKTILKEISTKAANYSPDDFEFNLQKSRKTLEANKTDNLLKEEKYFGQSWINKSLEERDRIVEFLFDKKDEEILKEALENWNLKKEHAENLVKLNIGQFGKTSVGNMSKEILQKIVSEIEKQNSEGKNCTYNKALETLEIDHSDEVYADGNGKELSYYGEAIPASMVKVKINQNKKLKDYTEEEKHGKIANPTVHTALNQLRKVVNSIIKENGNPSEIHVELARDLKINKDEKREIEKQQNENKKENERFAKDLKDFGQENNRANRLRLKLWEELNSKDCNDRRCAFCGNQIGRSGLFNHDIEIEHILPFSKTYDDGLVNKTLAHRSCNQKKGNRSPFEAFGDTTFERIQNLPKNKRWRFYENAMEKFNDESGFQERQLNDTRYLSKIARQYLAQVCDYNKIRVANGKLTALLRHHWGLNSILNKELESISQSESETLREATFDAETGEILESKEKEKNKKSKPKNRDDHRHHAVDAIAIAMTETRLLQQISRDNSRGHDLDRLIINLPSGWNRFREDAAEAIERIIVSHRPDHGKNTQLHDETYYGLLKEPTNIDDGKKSKEPYNLVASCSVLGLKKSEAKFIRDKKLREELVKLADLASSDKEFQTKFLPEFSKKTGVKNVRFYDKNSSIIEISHPQKNPRFSKVVKTNGNHHISLWKMPDGSIKTDVVSNFKMNCPFEIKEGYKGYKVMNKDKKFSQNQSYEKLKPHPAAKLLIRLFKDDLVRLEEGNKEKTVKISVIGSTSQCYYIEQNLAKSDKKTPPSFRLNESGVITKKIRKIFVTESGKVFDSGPILKPKEAK